MTTTVEPDGIVGWVVDLMEMLGAPGVGIAIALENVFPPLPSEVFLPLAGFAAAQGSLSLTAAIGWATLGSLVGAVALYGLGVALGRDRLRAIADRMPLVNVGDIDKAEAWFARHGAKAVFLGRMMPLVRSMISVPAGIERMNIALFAGLTALGSLIWNTAFIMAGYLLGENWGVVEQYAGIGSKVVLGLILLAVVVFVARRITARKREEEDPMDDTPTDRIPVVQAAVASGRTVTGQLPLWSANPLSTDWSMQPTQQIPTVAPPPAGPTTHLPVVPPPTTQIPVVPRTDRFPVVPPPRGPTAGGPDRLRGRPHRPDQ